MLKKKGVHHAISKKLVYYLYTQKINFFDILVTYKKFEVTY